MNKEVTLNSNCVATIIRRGSSYLAEGATYTIAQSLGTQQRSRCHWYVSGGEDQLSALGEEIKEEVLQADQAEESTGPLRRNRFGMHFADVLT